MTLPALAQRWIYSEPSMNLLKSVMNTVFLSFRDCVRQASHLAQALFAVSIVCACLALVAAAIIVKLAFGLACDLLSGVFHATPRSARG